MRKLVQILTAIIVVLMFFPAQAHEGHEHGPVCMKKATEIALATARDASQKALPALDLPQLDKSWRNLPESAAQIVENGRGFYWVKIENPAQAKALYVRIMLDGRVDIANFSGVSTSSSATYPESL